MATNQRPFVRFYHKDWASSGTIQEMTMEEVGVYWTLLVIQMVDGFVPADPKRLIRRLNAKDEADVKRMLTPLIMSKFKPLPDDPTKLYNEKLTEVIAATDAAKQSGSDGAFRRWNPDPMPEVDESSEKIDFSAHLKRMPKRKFKGKPDRAGWERGVALLKYITTQDEADRLYAAIDAYAKERNGEDAEYHMSFGNFMKEWESYVPQNYQLTAQPVEKPINQVGVAVIPKWKMGDTPPWIVNPHETEKMKAMRVAEWADRSKREKWLESRGYPKEWADSSYTVKEQN